MATKQNSLKRILDFDLHKPEIKVICLMSIQILHSDNKQTKNSGSVFRLQIQYFDFKIQNSDSQNKTNAA